MATITGTDARQTLSGTSSADSIFGLGGADQISGLGGNDIVSGGDGADRILGGDGNDVLYGHSVADKTPSSGNITATLVANVGSGAVFVTGAPGDNGFLYALAKDTGVISRINATTGAQTTFIDIPNNQFSSFGEHGVLGLAFHPDYASNGRFFVFLTQPDGDLEVKEYARGGGVTPVQTIITIPHPGFGNHNGGSLAFGPDGYLYISTGDGGGGNDPDGNAQNLASRLGKILRIDVNGDDFLSGSSNYAIPDDNPFASSSGVDEIWAYGLRNPWRISFDSATGDLYIGDVGQEAREEVDFEPNSSPGGRNYGWDFREGNIQGPSPPPNPPNLVGPVFDYTHDVGSSITGGDVYRGPAPGLDGAYFFADFISGRVFTLRMVNGQPEDIIERTGQVSTDLSRISSFGTDNAGNLYAVLLSGEIYRLTPGAAAGDGADVLQGGAGNDTLFGGIGNDVLRGESGADNLDGGNGNDQLGGGDGNDVISGGDGNDVINGDAGSDVLRGAGGNDSLSGGADNDRLGGGDGNDVINGGTGADLLYGDAGNDVLIGGEGNDTMFGAAGNDSFKFSPAFGDDSISGFDSAPAGGQDHLDVSDLAINASNFLTEVDIEQSGADALVILDEGTIRLVNVNASTISPSDFLF